MLDTITFFTILQVSIVLLLILVVLFQRNGTDGLAGLSGGGHGAVSSKISGSIMTKVTFFLAAAFMINGLVLAKLTISDFKSSSDILDSISIPENKGKVQSPTEQKPVVPKVG